MKMKKTMAAILTVALASQMMVPVAFGAEADEVQPMEGLHLVEATEDVVGDGYAFDYAEDGSTFTVTDDVFIQDTYGIVLPGNATLVVEEDASLSIYAETYGIYADGDVELVLDGDVNIVVGMEGATMADSLFAIVAAGTYDADGNFGDNGNLTIEATGNMEMVARDGIYCNGDMNITGGTWDMNAYITLSNSGNNIILQDGVWNIVAEGGIVADDGNVTIENCEFNMLGIVAATAGNNMTIGDGCLVTSGGAFVGADISVSETSDVNAMIGYNTTTDDGTERPWTIMVYGDTVFTMMSGESDFLNDHIVFAEGATLTIAEDAIFSLAPSEKYDGDLGSTMDATGGTIINNGVMVFKAGTTEEEIEAMNIQGDGAVGVMTAEEDLYSLPYTDVSESNWFYDSVYFVTGFGLMAGISETEFAPNMPMTREMLLDAMYHLSGGLTPEGVDAYEYAMDWAVEVGVSDGSDPEGAVTRQEMAAILYRCLGEPEVEGDLTAFVDGDNISEYAKEPMVWAVSAGLISGKPDGTLDAKGDATRAQVANILLRLVQQMVGA